jgi:hypothetical protein
MSTEATTAITAEDALAGMKGQFVESLTRGSKKIKADRALVIAESAQLIYKRSIEDLEMDIKTTQREQANQLDLSPTTSDSLELAKNFDALEFVKKDQAYTLKLRELRIRLEEYKARYAVLFG